MIEFYIILIASLTAATCALPGVFLTQRKMSMMSDAVSHVALPGIVVAFMIVQNRYSPWLILGAGMSGLAMSFLIEMINKTKLVKEDAAIGLVFPAMFSVGVILISQNLSNVHFHESSVILGDLALASINNFVVGGKSIGPKAIYQLGGLLLINIAFIALFFKELKITTFDEGLAASLGFKPAFMHYSFMGLVSITAVGAFDSVGSILVVALMIAPASAAYLLSDNLASMLFISVGVGVASAVSGFYIADFADSTPSGAMAAMTGVFFVAAFMFAPKRGFVAAARRRKRQKLDFSQSILLIHLSNHESKPEEVEACSEASVKNLFSWTDKFYETIVQRSIKNDLISASAGSLRLTENGRKASVEEMIDKKIPHSDEIEFVNN